ncbi:MAG: DEAD/DEAH box helicase [Gemmatimonadetes bacterium]|nr:DEAD/DEAH box helicase [Gemmatimonadota bacterium]
MLPTLGDATAALRRFYGFDAFRPMQRRVIHAVLQGRDVLGVLPTGGGKSLCYQVPALCTDGLTVVFSPLVSLMKDERYENGGASLTRQGNR